MLVRTSGMESETRYYCKDVSIVIRGVEFLANLILLKSQGMDIILGMDWLTKYDGDIKCKDKVVHLTSAEGLVVTYTATQPISPLWNPPPYRDSKPGSSTSGL